MLERLNDTVFAGRLDGITKFDQAPIWVLVLSHRFNIVVPARRCIGDRLQPLGFSRLGNLNPRVGPLVPTLVASVRDLELPNEMTSVADDTENQNGRSRSANTEATSVPGRT